MRELSEVVSMLESKIQHLLNTHQRLQATNQSLQDTVNFLTEKNDALNTQLGALQKEQDALKIANSILGSDQNKRIAKLKINALIKQVSQNKLYTF